ncbi:MAG TPA: hypothetical protein VGD71_23825 [Kribbella sp.]|jgi:hypothetical protein
MGGYAALLQPKSRIDPTDRPRPDTPTTITAIDITVHTPPLTPTPHRDHTTPRIPGAVPAANASPRS